VGSEYMGSFRDPNTGQRRPSPNERFIGPRTNDSFLSSDDEDATQPRLAVPSPQATVSRQKTIKLEQPRPPESQYREHVSGMLYVPRSEAPKFYPAYNPYYATPPQYAGQPGQPGAVRYPPPQGYNGYPYPYGQPVPYGYYPYYPYNGYAWAPQKPKRSAYEITVGIISFIGSILAILTGGVCVLLLLLVAAFSGQLQNVSASASFTSIVQFTAFAAAGILGGVFGFYHSIRALFLKKPSAQFKLPWFWIFLLLYLVIIAIGTWMRVKGLAVANLPLTIVLIALAGIFPLATIAALGVRRIHYPKKAPWPTTWRRFTLSLVSGATLAILLASVFELVLALVAARQFGLTNIPLDNPDQPIPGNPRAIMFVFILVSVIAPLVEETVKPLAVVLLIGRVRSAAEAFVLGMAGGIGFALVETTGYIGMGYKDWIDVAVQRSTAGLLHGFGAGMVALGWYFITHRKSTKKVNRVLLAFGCWTYALLQHGIWNGSFGLQLLPAPIGPYLDKGTITLGPLKFESFLLVYVALSLLILIFFLYVTKKLRMPIAPPIPTASPKPDPSTTPQAQEPRVPVRT
jgi:RsiW-degrading membrane proteinase PrsW (M82 family)